ncbi:MAG: antibiotic biosynthesis monooxygenase family protein [Gemmatimonadota bacterium]
MIALLFEVTPRPGAQDEYLAIAARLRPALDAIGGCLFIDRFRSLRRPGSLLSFQIWRDEASLVRWRVEGEHHRAQTLGRSRIFSDYRLRIAQVIRDERDDGALWRPQRLSPYNDPAARAPRYVAIAESRSAGLSHGTATESFESIYRPGAFAHVFDLMSPDDATLAALGQAQRLRVCEIERDYGMFDRSEAPQFYPPLEKSE